MNLDAIGKILAAGFGDKVLMGIITGFLEGVSPDRAYEYIRDNINLGYWVSDDDWEKYTKLARQANIGSVTKEDITNDLRKHNPDILGVIINTDGGDEWLDAQVEMIRSRLS